MIDEYSDALLTVCMYVEGRPLIGRMIQPFLLAPWTSAAHNTWRYWQDVGTIPTEIHFPRTLPVKIWSEKRKIYI